MADSNEVDDAWVEGFSQKHQRSYWRNKVTKETSWKPPPAVTRGSNSSSNRPLPPKPPKPDNSSSSSLSSSPSPVREHGSTKNPLARQSSKRPAAPASPPSSSPPPPLAPPPAPPPAPVSPSPPSRADEDIEMTSVYSSRDEFPGVDGLAAGEYEEEEDINSEQDEVQQDHNDGDGHGDYRSSEEDEEQQHQQQQEGRNSNKNNRPQSWLKVTKSKPPSAHGAQAGNTFGDYWVGAAKNIDGHELIGNWKEVQATLGVVAALLLSIVFGRVGLDYEKHDDTFWGQTAGIAQTVSTCCNFLNTIICLYITITSARAYILLCMYPADQGKVAFAHIGSTFLVDIPYLLWPVLSSLFIVDALIMATLATPYYVGVALVLFTAVVTPLCIGSWVKLDNNGATGLKAISIITVD